MDISATTLLRRERQRQQRRRRGTAVRSTEPLSSAERSRQYRERKRLASTSTADDGDSVTERSRFQRPESTQSSDDDQVTGRSRSRHKRISSNEAGIRIAATDETMIPASDTEDSDVNQPMMINSTIFGNIKSPFSSTVTALITINATNDSTIIKYVKYMTEFFFSDSMQDYCRVCDRIWWSSCLRLLSTIKKPIVRKTLKRIGYDPDDPQFKFCATCGTRLNKGEVPQMATINGYTYPPIPNDLPTLTPIEERLISPRLPFMQIRHIRYFPGAKHIVGQIINVPIDVDVVVRSLPRQLDDDTAFNICLKRHLSNKSSYMSGSISKRNIKQWLKFLLETPLYREQGITLDDSFFDNVPDTSELQNDESAADIMIIDREEWLLQHKSHERNFTVIESDRADAMNDEEFLALQQQTFWGEDMILNMAPTTGKQPFALSFDEDAEELSFPSIYFGQRREFKIRATHYSKASSELRRRDRRGVRSDHVLYLAAKIMHLRIIDSFNVMFKTKRRAGVDITRENLADPNFVKELMERNESFLRTIPNSVQYWHQRKCDLFTMMRQLGKPTIFLTLSASEIHWPDLLRSAYIFKYQNDETSDDRFPTNDELLQMPAAVRAELINDDPVICCLYFERLVAVIVKALQRNDGPFGRYRVVDFFRRIEFQHRGSPHCHMLLWLENTPTQEEVDTLTDVAGIVRLIDALSTVDSTLLSSDRALQTHHHTHTCYKKINKKCRFEAPFWPMDQTRVLIPIEEDAKQQSYIQRYQTMHSALENNNYATLDDFLGVHTVETLDEYLLILRHGIFRPKIFMKRSMSDIWTSPFNPAISAILQSNMDVQFILDAYSCAAYVAEYINKSNRGFSSLHRELIRVRDEYPDMDYETCMKTLGKQVLSSIEMCTQEAAWFLLRLRMSEMSRKVQMIPTEHPSLRFLTRKSESLMNAEHLSGKSTDVWHHNLVQRYEKRATSLSDMYLAKFVADYDEVRHRQKQTPTVAIPEQFSEADNSLSDASNADPFQVTAVELTYRKRKCGPKIIKWVNYQLASDPLNYKREMVTLFWPFRSEELDLLNNDKFLQIYESNIELLQTRRKEYDGGLSAERIAALVAQANEVIPATDDDAQQPGPLVRSVDESIIDAPMTIHPNNDDLNTLNRNTIVRPILRVVTHADYCVMMRTLNVGQKTFALEFLNRLVYERDKPMQVFLTGPAGAGKTFLLKAIMETCNRFSQRHNASRNAYVACATTGKAAVNIDGTTVHTAFNIGISASRRLPLKGDTLQTMRCDFAEVTTIIIDEISMASQDILNTVYERLCLVGVDMTKPFGNFHVIMCGDLRQLPPVNTRAVYVRPSNMLQDRMIWQGLRYYPLTEVMRQSDVVFSTLLTKIGTGDELTKSQRRLIASRFVDKESTLNDPNLVDAIRIYFRNSDVDNYNYNTLMAHPNRTIVMSNDAVMGNATDEQITQTLSKLQSMVTSKTGNMVGSLVLVYSNGYSSTT